ncbi:MAG: AAA family ATPase [Gammaproteobacteria bacterium]
MSESLIEKAIERLTKGGDGHVRRDVDRRSRTDTPLLVDGGAGAIEGHSPADRDLQMRGGTGNAVISGALPWLPRTAGGKSRSVDIDLERLEKQGFVTPKSRNKRLAEEIRVIKRRVLMNAVDLAQKRANTAGVVLVTSAMPGEGKTFLAVNLAISIAMEIDRTALLIDADAAKAKLTRVLGLRSYGGLADVISGGEPDLRKVLLATNIGRLKILPAGTRHAEMAEYVGSRRTELLIKELALRYPDQIVVVDSPPLLATVEACSLARMVEQVVIVVETERTKRSDLITALNLLEPSKTIGLVLNKANEREETKYYESYLAVPNDTGKMLSSN